MTPRPDRIAALSVEALALERYRVTGGAAPHVVDFSDPTHPTCDCEAARYQPGSCKHIARVDRERRGLPWPAGSGPAPDVLPLGVIPAKRLRLLDAVELLALPPVTWQLDGYLPAGGLSVLYGAPGTGKSFLALDWAVCIATGRPWQGRTVTQGSVVYVAPEGAHGLGARLHAYLEAHGIPAAELAGRFAVVPDVVNLLDSGHVAELVTTVSGATLAQPIRFTVFDTLARSMPGGDENSTQDVGGAVAGADAVRRTTGCGVLIVHHTGKQGDVERGSSALRGAADAMFSLTLDDPARVLKVDKQKDAAPADPIRLRLVAGHGSCVLEPDDTVTAGPMLTPAELATLRALYAIVPIGAPGATTADWKAATLDGPARPITAQKSHLDRATYFRARKRLLDLHHVQCDYTTKLYTLTGTGVALC